MTTAESFWPDQWIKGLLLELEEYFDQRADAEYLPGQAAPQGNEEMRLLCDIRDILKESQSI